MSQISDVKIDKSVVVAPKMSNPAAVGLAAFGTTTLLLQFHALGWVGMGPVLAMALFYGGLAQFVAGLQEFKTGNSFAYTVFTSLGCFWMSFATIVMLSKLGVFTASKADIGWFLVVWAVYVAVLLPASLHTNKMLGGAFITVELGVLFLVAENFGAGEWAANASIAFMLGAVACVYYGVAHIACLEVFGRDVLPVGKPMI